MVSFETIDGFDQPDRADLLEIFEGLSPVLEARGDRSYEPEMLEHEALAFVSGSGGRQSIAFVTAR